MNYPITQVLSEMAEQVERGNTVWFKFDCGNCGSRQTSSDANCFHLGGYTCEECGYLTKPTEGNYLLLIGGLNEDSSQSL